MQAIKELASIFKEMVQQIAATPMADMMEQCTNPTPRVK
jgi:hypothetical protein